MKGLIIKDIKLLAGQKKIYPMFFLIGIMLVITGVEPTFFVVYMTTMFMMCSITTLTYDEYENGMQFLLTLPVSAKTYVGEKYVFSTGASTIATIGSMIVYFLYSFCAGNVQVEEIKDIILICLCEYLAVLFILLLTLPLIIYFGAEKGRLVLISIIVCLTLVATFVKKLLEELGIDNQFIESIEGNITGMFMATAVFVVVGLLISFMISMHILEKKEY